MLNEWLSLLGLSTAPPDLWRIATLVLVAVAVGMGKAGLSGAVILAIPLLASSMGARESTGLMLTLFLLGDVFAVKAYRKHANLGEIGRLLPSTVVGLGLGAVVGSLISAQQFKWAIAGVVLVCLAFMGFQEWRNAEKAIPRSIALALLIGALSGFTSMIGNAAGPIFAVYLLAMGFDKNRFLGTTAVFFLIVNLLKMPLQILVWHNVDWATLLAALTLLPAVYLGIVLGMKLLKILKERTFRFLMIGMTALAAVRLMLP